MKTILILSLILFIGLIFFSCHNNGTDLLDNDENSSSSLKFNIIVPNALSSFDVKVGINVNYNFPNSDPRDVVKYECNDRAESSQFIETVVPQLKPGSVKITCKIYYLSGTVTSNCNNNMTGWTLYCVATKSNVNVIANQLTLVPMDFICSENPNDFGDIEITVDDVYLAKWIAGATYVLPTSSSSIITSGQIEPYVHLEAFKGNNTASGEIQIDNPTPPIYSGSASGTFDIRVLVPQDLYTSTSTPTIWLRATKTSPCLEKWEPVILYQYHNAATVILSDCSSTSITPTSSVCDYTKINATYPFINASSTVNFYVGSTSSLISGTFFIDTICPTAMLLYSIDGNIWSPFYNYSMTGSSYNYWNSWIDIDTLAIGLHSIVYKIEDGCGCVSLSDVYRFNVSSSSSNCADTRLGVTMPFNGTSTITIQSDATCAVSGTYHTNAICSSATVFYSFNNYTWYPVDFQSTSGSSSGNQYWYIYDINSPSLGSGYHMVKFKVEDDCGCSALTNYYYINVLSSTSITPTSSVCDQSGIGIISPFIDGSSIVTFTSGSYFTVYGTLSSDTMCSSNSIYASIDGNTWSLIDIESISGTGNENWSSYIYYSTLSNGLHTVLFKVENECGCSVQTVVYRFNKVTNCSNPVISIVQPITGSYTASSNIPFSGTFSLSSSSTHTIYYSIDSGNWLPVSSYNPYSMTGSWVKSFLSGTSLGYGSHNLWVKIIDSFGCSDSDYKTIVIY